MLADLRTYLQQRPTASLADIALHLGVEPDVARAMCAIWIGKGKLERFVGDKTCGGCNRCVPGSLELYRWIADGAARAAQHCASPAPQDTDASTP